MREVRDVAESERTTTTLDRVCGPKDRIDLFRVRGSRVHAQKPRLHYIQALEALFEEHLVELRHIKAHSALLSV